MKGSVLLVTLLLIAGVCFSQEKMVLFGVHGGINIANINSKFTYSNWGTSYTTDLPFSSITGLTGGVHVEIHLGNHFYLQPALSYSQLGAKSVSSYLDSTSSSGKLELKSVLHYITVPVLLKYKFWGTSASLFVGPQYGYLVGVTNRINSTTINEKDESNYKSDIAGVFGAEYYLPMGFGISARYQLGISNIQKPEYFDTGTLPQDVVAKSFSVRNCAFTFTIGYRF